MILLAALLVVKAVHVVAVVVIVAAVVAVIAAAVTTAAVTIAVFVAGDANVDAVTVAFLVELRLQLLPSSSQTVFFCELKWGSRFS